MPAAVAGFGVKIPFLHIKEISGPLSVLYCSSWRKVPKHASMTDFPRCRLLDMSLRLMSSRQMTLYRSTSFLLSLCQKSRSWLWIFCLSFRTCSFSFHRLCESFSFRLSSQASSAIYGKSKTHRPEKQRIKMYENLKKINESVENNKNGDTISFTILTDA